MDHIIYSWTILEALHHEIFSSMFISFFSLRFLRCCLLVDIHEQFWILVIISFFSSIYFSLFSTRFLFWCLSSDGVAAGVIGSQNSLLNVSFLNYGKGSLFFLWFSIPLIFVWLLEQCLALNLANVCLYPNILSWWGEIFASLHILNTFHLSSSQP